MTQMKEGKLVYVGTRYGASEWSGEEDTIIMLKDGGEDVEVQITHPARVSRGEFFPISVVYGGAVDFDGNKREFVKRYPDIHKFLKTKGLMI
jgi:hypothetical protein